MELASLAQLDRCHRRHDSVMSELLEAARRFAAGRPDDGDLARVHEAVAYFERAITRHFVDEDGSVFPRLSTRRPELSATLAELSAEHPVQIAMQAEVAAAARELDGESRPSAGKTLLDAATRLAEAHHAHVAREDAIFATAKDALSAEDDAEISAEMEMRRDREGGGHRRGGGGGGGGGGRGGGGGGGGGGRQRETAKLTTKHAVAPRKTTPTAKAKLAARKAKPAARKAKPAARKAKPAAAKAKPAKRTNAKRAGRR